MINIQNQFSHKSGHLTTHTNKATTIYTALAQQGISRIYLINIYKNTI